MGVRTIIECTCDFENCKNNAGQNGPAMVAWCNEDIRNKLTTLPEEVKSIVELDLNGTKLVFCGKRHAAEFFLPPGLEVTQRKLSEFPKPKNSSIPVNGQEGA